MTARFRIRSGEIEVEYEGEPSETAKRFDEILTWVREEKPVTFGPISEKREEGRLERRSGEIRIIVDRLTTLKDEGFFELPKELGVVKKEMQTRGWYHTPPNIQSALLRHGPRLGIKRIQEGGKYLYVKA